MSVENQDAFRRPYAMVVPNFQVYAIRRSVILPINSLNVINDHFLLLNIKF